MWALLYWLITGRKPCQHKWKTYLEGNVVWKKGDIPHGYYFLQECEVCGDFRKKTV